MSGRNRKGSGSSIDDSASNVLAIYDVGGERAFTATKKWAGKYAGTTRMEALVNSANSKSGVTSNTDVAGVIGETKERVAKTLSALDVVKSVGRDLEGRRNDIERRRRAHVPEPGRIEFDCPGDETPKGGRKVSPSLRKAREARFKANRNATIMAAVSCALLGTLVIGVEFVFAIENVRAGSLYETASTDAMMPPKEPSVLTCLSVAFAPVITTCGALELINAENFKRNRDSTNRIIGYTLLALTVCGLPLFYYHTLGWGEPKVVGKITIAAKGLPFYVASVFALSTAILGSILFNKALKNLRTLFQMVPSTDTVAERFEDELAHANEAIAINGECCGTLNGWLERDEKSLADFDAAMAAKERAKAEQKKRQADLENISDASIKMFDTVTKMVAEFRDKWGLSILLAATTSLTCASVGCQDQKAREPEHSAAYVDGTDIDDERFVFDDGHFPPDRMVDVVDELLTERFVGGTVAHFYRGPDREKLATIPIPYGNIEQRLRNPWFAESYQRVLDAYGTGVVQTDRCPSATGIARKIQEDRRDQTSNVEVLLFSTPVFSEPQTYPAFDCSDFRVIGPGEIGAPGSPLTMTPLPTGTRIEIWHPAGMGGKDNQHREELRMMVRNYVAVLGGHVARIGSDLELAGASAGSELPPVIGQLDGKNGMIVTRVKIDPPESIVNAPRKLPVTASDGSSVFDEIAHVEGSFAAEIAAAGGSVHALKRMRIRLAIVIDASSSMTESLSDWGTVLHRSTEELSPLVSRLEVGFSVRTDKEDRDFLPTVIRPGQFARSAIDRFIRDDVKVLGSDESVADMFSAGTKFLPDDRHHDRSILVVVSDRIEDEVDGVVDAFNRWVAGDRTRRLVLIQSGGSVAQTRPSNTDGLGPGITIAHGTDALIRELVDLSRGD